MCVYVRVFWERFRQLYSQAAVCAQQQWRRRNHLNAVYPKIFSYNAHLPMIISAQTRVEDTTYNGTLQNGGHALFADAFFFSSL